MFQSTVTRSGTSPAARTSRPSRPSPAWLTSNPRFSSVPLTIRRIARESSITRARTSGPLQWAVGGAAADDDPLPGVVHPERRLCRTEEQPAVGAHELTHPPEDRLLRGQVEVDEDVAQVDHVERAHPRQRPREVALARRHHPAQRGVDLPLGPGTGEVPDEHGGRQPAVDLELAEPAGPGPLDHLAGEVGRGDRDAAGGVRQRVLEQHRDRVRLLPAGAGGRPDLQPIVGSAGGEQLRQHRRGERGERVTVTEPRGLVGGQRLDDLPGAVGAGLGAHRLDVLRDVGDALPAGDRQQPRLDEVLLARLENDGALLVHERTDPVEAGGGEGHRGPPAGMAPVRAWTPARWRLMASGMRSSGRVSSARPAWAIAPGIPHTTEVAWSCTTTVPPAERISAAPLRPSEPIPVSTTARTAPS